VAEVETLSGHGHRCLGVNTPKAMFGRVGVQSKRSVQVHHCVCVTSAPFPIVAVPGLDHPAQFVQSCASVSLCHVTTSWVVDELADGLDGGMASGLFRGNKKPTPG
jgi:hypothetical protein